MFHHGHFTFSIHFQVILKVSKMTPMIQLDHGSHFSHQSQDLFSLPNLWATMIGMRLSYCLFTLILGIVTIPTCLIILRPKTHIRLREKTFVFKFCYRLCHRCIMHLQQSRNAGAARNLVSTSDMFVLPVSCFIRIAFDATDSRTRW